MHACNIPNYISSHVCLLKGARMYVKDVFGQDCGKKGNTKIVFIQRIARVSAQFKLKQSCTCPCTYQSSVPHIQYIETLWKVC